MRDQNTLRNVGKMISHKENMDDLLEHIKEMENYLGDNLQQTLTKSSSLVKMNKNLKEIQVMSKFLSDSLEEKEGFTEQKLRDSLRRKIYENQNLILKELQKSMLIATEALAEAEGNLILFSSFNQIVKTFDSIEKNM